MGWLEDERRVAKRLSWVYWFIAVDVVFVAAVVVWATVFA